MKFIMFSISLCLFISAHSQLSTYRGLVQRKVLFNKILKPQLEKHPLTLKDEKQVADFFALLEKTWADEAADSLKKYPSSFSPEEYKQLDAYSYLWALASVQQQMDAGNTHADQLIYNYMAPAILRDLTTLERLRNYEVISQIDAGSLGNTLAIGTMPSVNKQTFLASAEVYKKANQVFTSLLDSRDTNVSKASAMHLKSMEVNRNPILAGKAFYSGQPDSALRYLLTGLAAHAYSPSRAIGLSKKLVPALLQKGNKTACLELLQSMASNITPDNLDRDALLQLYLQVDPADGRSLCDAALARSTGPIFTSTGSSVTLPGKWSFIVNPISTEQISKAKYIFVDLWYSSCGPCIAEIPELNEFAASIKERDDMLFISINTDYLNGGKQADFVKKRSGDFNIKFPVIYDDAILQLSKQLGVDSYPHKFILDAKGNLITKADQSPLSLDSFNLFLKENKR